MSSRRHEQAEREMVAREAGDFVKLMASIAAIYLFSVGPWQLFQAHHRPWGLALLAVIVNIIGGLIVILIIAVKVNSSRAKAKQQS